MNLALKKILIIIFNDYVIELNALFSWERSENQHRIRVSESQVHTRIDAAVDQH